MINHQNPSEHSIEEIKDRLSEMENRISGLSLTFSIGVGGIRDDIADLEDSLDNNSPENLSDINTALSNLEEHIARVSETIQSEFNSAFDPQKRKERKRKELQNFPSRAADITFKECYEAVKRGDTSLALKILGPVARY